jgi:hypothetical protein
MGFDTSPADKELLLLERLQIIRRRMNTAVQKTVAFRYSLTLSLLQQ